VDLLGTLEAARHLRDFAREVRRETAPWENDEVAFHAHFGVPFEAYAELVQHLNEQQQELLKATINVNPEAAVLWILAMEEM
jgi:hypothetical protein